MTDPIPNSERVQVSRTDGRLTIGTPFGADARSAVLPVYAGVLAVNPFRPHTAPYTDLQFCEPDDRFGWLVNVYGVEVARFVMGEEDGDVSLPWRPGPLHPLLARLAVARWLVAWNSSAGLDRRLLDAEIGHLTVRCADAVHQAEDVAAEHLNRAGDLLRWLADPALAEHGGGLTAATARAVRLWAGTAVDLLGAVAFPSARVRTALRERRTEDLINEDEPFPVLAAREEIIDDIPRVGLGTVDRVQVVPDVVDESPDAVHWTVSDEMMRVWVGHGRRTDVAPWVRVYQPEDPLPIALAPMRLSDEDWEAEFMVPRMTDEVVDVFSPEVSRPARLGDEAMRAKLERDAAYQLGRTRTYLYNEPAWLPALVPTLRDLGTTFATIPGRPDELARTLTEAAAELQTAGAHPAWRLTVAELARLDPSLLSHRYNPQS